MADTKLDDGSWLAAVILPSLLVVQRILADLLVSYCVHTDGTLYINIQTGLTLTFDPRVQKVEIDSFSGYRIYPSKGRLFVRGDSKVRFTAHRRT
jgi:hypothetical protein